MSINYFSIHSQEIHMYVWFPKYFMNIITYIPLKTGLRRWWYKVLIRNIRGSRQFKICSKNIKKCQGNFNKKYIFFIFCG